MDEKDELVPEVKLLKITLTYSLEGTTKHITCLHCDIVRDI